MATTAARGARQPKANADYWRAKIGRNQARDASNEAQLRADGWAVITVWECEMRHPGFGEALIARLLETDS